MTLPLDAIPFAVPVERRRHRRIDTRMLVEVGTIEGSQEARITNLSQRGTSVELSESLIVGTPVIVKRAGVALAGRVVWSKGTTAGIEFMLPLDPGDFLQIRRGLAANL
jgi:hypothetical protein